MFNKPTTVGQTVTINGTGTATTGTAGTFNGYSDLCISSGYTNANTTTITGNLVLNNNTTSMNQQVKVAVFKVERNKHNEIKSSEFITEMWVENKPGVSIDFVVARKLDGKYDAYEIVIKQIFAVTL
jgi:hypothetical protein